MCSFLSTTTSGRLPCDESIGWQVEVGVLPQHDFPAIGSPPLWGNKNMEIMRYINTWFQYLSALKKICPYINSNHFGSYLCPFSSPLRSSCWCCTWSTCWNHHLTLAAQQDPKEYWEHHLLHCPGFFRTCHVKSPKVAPSQTIQPSKPRKNEATNPNTSTRGGASRNLRHPAHVLFSSSNLLGMLAFSPVVPYLEVWSPNKKAKKKHWKG